MNSVLPVFYTDRHLATVCENRIIFYCVTSTNGHLLFILKCVFHPVCDIYTFMVHLDRIMLCITVFHILIDSYVISHYIQHTN